MNKNDLEKEIIYLKEDFPKLNNLKEEDLFSLICLKYFYHPDDFTYTHYKECFVDGKNDGGIDLVVINDLDSYSATLSLIQSKYVSAISNKQDIKDIFTKIHQTYEDFNNNKTSKYNPRLKRILKDKLDYIDDMDNLIEFVLFISVDVDEKRKEEIQEAINCTSSLNDYLVTIYYLDDILAQISSVNDPKRFVDEGKISISKNDGTLKFGDHGLLVNVSSNSLRDLYDRYKNKGLFEQNFRYFIRNKKIDDKIRSSLQRKRDDFWFLNNGIIISCKDFKPDGDNIKLWDFSIVNGCQTTTLIGEYKGKNENDDFYLPCKIVKSKSDNEVAFSHFMSEIAEASNSQKPISDRDLKSNRPEQRNLQKLLKENEPFIYLEIKRGENNKKGLENWQRIKNDELGQYILSFNLQQPGTARSGKRRIFSSDKTYRSVFLRHHSKDNIVDVLKLKEYYNGYVDKQLKEDKFVDLEQESVARNGRFIVISLIGLFLKHKRELITFKGFARDENWNIQLEKDNLDGNIFDIAYTNDDFHLKLNGLFQLIIMELSNLYKMREKEEKTVSNFFKADSKYQKIIIKHFIDSIFNNEYRMREVDNYLEIFEKKITTANIL
ncbi:AIPR family protein [uncultured Draconibacterium sp.]|uniref:AIPR family protein n=1 Tax=uncultured Draconibacterium sp. TaxID=1573823 RepID=UPI003216BB65